MFGKDAAPVFYSLPPPPVREASNKKYLYNWVGGMGEYNFLKKIYELEKVWKKFTLTLCTVYRVACP